MKIALRQRNQALVADHALVLEKKALAGLTITRIN
jgi:hypothetical protein